MTIEAGRTFWKKLDAASEAEVVKALALLQKQTGGFIASSWVTTLAIKMMQRLKLKYVVVTHDFKTGEQTNVRQN